MMNTASLAAASSPALPSRFFNPLALWADVAAKTGDMMFSASTVVQIRTERMVRSTLGPTSDADALEFGLMGQEKVAAVAEAGTAMANQLHVTQFALTHRVVRQSLEAAEALASLMVSLSPSQAAAQTRRWLNATQRTVATATQLGSAPARIAQRGLRPIHERAASNARRLTAPAPASAA